MRKKEAYPIHIKGSPSCSFQCVPPLSTYVRYAQLLVADEMDVHVAAVGAHRAVLRPCLLPSSIHGWTGGHAPVNGRDGGRYWSRYQLPFPPWYVHHKVGASPCRGQSFPAATVHPSIALSCREHDSDSAVLAGLPCKRRIRPGALLSTSPRQTRADRLFLVSFFFFFLSSRDRFCH